MNCKCTLNEPLERHVFHDWDVRSLWRLFCIWKGVLVKKTINFDWQKSILFDWQLLKWKCLQFGFGANNWRPKALTETCGLLLFLRKSIFDVFWLNFSLHFQLLKVRWFWHILQLHTSAQHCTFQHLASTSYSQHHPSSLFPKNVLLSSNLCLWLQYPTMRTAWSVSFFVYFSKTPPQYWLKARSFAYRVVTTAPLVATSVLSLLSFQK